MLLTLFLTFLKIGAFTFGGGYAMVALLEPELIEKKNWISRDDFLDMVAIAESTPGPVAINAATFIGCRMAGVRGAAAATLGVCLPSFVIIYLISLFLDQFLAVRLIACAFAGIRVCVVYLILCAGWRLFRGMEKSAWNLAILITVCTAMTLLSLLSVSFSSIFYILLCGGLGMLVCLVRQRKDRGGNKG